MSDNRAAFVNFKAIEKGTWPVSIASDQNLWVQGKGDIRIKRRANDQWLDGTLHDVLYIPNLRTNLNSLLEEQLTEELSLFTARIHVR